jgi:hypothetical protein
MALSRIGKLARAQTGGNAIVMRLVYRLFLIVRPAQRLPAAGL